MRLCEWFEENLFGTHQDVVNNDGNSKSDEIHAAAAASHWWKVMKLMPVRIEDIITPICQSLDNTVCTHLLMTLTSSKNMAVWNYLRFIEGIVEYKKKCA